MKLSKLIIAIDKKLKSEDVDVEFLTDDSRKCVKNSIFVAHENGHKYVDSAIENGAVFVISNEKVCENCIVVEDTRKTYSTLCRAFFGYPDKKLKLVAVTGTNGKTSVATMIYTILKFVGYKVGLLGTICNEIAEKRYDSTLTTSDCFEFNKMLSELCEKDFHYCVLEASSQGLAQQRLYGIEFEIGIFTNLTIDHLDYHQAFENYKKAKQILFKNSRVSVINFDDAYANDMIESAKDKVITFSVKSNLADFTAKNISFDEKQIKYALVANSLIYRINLNLQGDFFIYNSMAAIIAAYELAVNLDDCSKAIKTINQIKGRFETLSLNTPYQVIIDYAHTPDGLKQVILSVRHFCKGKIITVFGCGGDRDKSKRSQMGEVASNLSDIVVVTSDNPRTEEPMQIIEDILVGVKKPKSQLFIHENRSKAIEFALKKAKKDDVVLLAGKGHEDYQIIKNKKIHYDEREIVKNILSI